MPLRCYSGARAVLVGKSKTIYGRREFALAFSIIMSRSNAGADFLGVSLKFSSTPPPKKNSKSECALHVSIIIDLIERKFQLEGQV